MGISAKELAARISVSPATVSMVLNNKQGIGEETRRRVLEAARQYGYDLSRHAASLPSPAQSDYSIHFVLFKRHGAVVADTPFFAELLEGFTQACTAMKCPYKVSYHYYTKDFAQQVQANGYQDASGLILLGTEMEPSDIQQFLSLGIPCVILDCYYDEIQADFVLINNVQGAYLATKHLIDSGHRSIGYLRSSRRIANFEERANGYYNALRRHGIDTSHPYVFSLAPTADQGYEDMLQCLSGEPPLATAYFADNDIIAAAASRAFAEKGLLSTRPISIIGFDDMPFCQLMTPALSTMRVAKRSLATIAVDRLIEKLRQPASTCRKISIATSLISRDSVYPRNTETE